MYLKVEVVIVGARGMLVLLNRGLTVEKGRVEGATCDRFLSEEEDAFIVLKMFTDMYDSR
jgi:hypothetical protein